MSTQIPNLQQVKSNIDRLTRLLNDAKGQEIALESKKQFISERLQQYGVTLDTLPHVIDDLQKQIISRNAELEALLHDVETALSQIR